jgi:hypothetical protein
MMPKGAHIEMPEWIPLFALPNIDIVEPIETNALVLVSVRDERIKQLTKEHASFATYLKRFRTEFNDPVSPSVILWRSDAEQNYRTVEAIAGFRDAIAVSTIPYSWAHVLRFENNFSIKILESLRILSLDD